MGFPPVYHLATDEMPEFFQDTVLGQTSLRLRAHRRSSHRARDVLVARPFQHLANSGFKWNAFRLHNCFVTGARIFSKFVERKSRTKDFYQSLFGVCHRDADQHQVNFIGQIKSKPSSSLGPRPFVNSFGIEKKPVHIEDKCLYVFHVAKRRSQRTVTLRSDFSQFNRVVSRSHPARRPEKYQSQDRQRNYRELHRTTCSPRRSGNSG